MLLHQIYLRRPFLYLYLYLDLMYPRGLSLKSQVVPEYPSRPVASSSASNLQVAYRNPIPDSGPCPFSDVRFVHGSD